MELSLRREHPIKRGTVPFIAAITMVLLCAFQFGDRNELNKMAFAKVQSLASDLEKAERLAKQGNIDLFTGQLEPGKVVTLRGEVTDANCYLGTHIHAYDHAFCAKVCAAAGGPLVFIADQDSEVYVVMSERNGVRLPDDVLDRIGVPGIVVRAKVLSTDGVRALAVEGLAE